MSVAGDLRTFVVDQLELLAGHHLDDWQFPAVFAGHPVRPEVVADLAFTLGHLHEAGIDDVAGTPVPVAISRTLRHIDGLSNHSFFCYRVAETVGRFGPLAGNALTEGWAAGEIENLAEACDATSFVPLLDEGHLPRNYAAVLARCEAARADIGIEHDAELLDRLGAATVDMLAGSSTGFLDDSQSRFGRYDIYTPDVYLFTEPLESRLGDCWERGARAALGLVDRCIADNGAAVVWGRSTGALALCLTIELTAMTLDRQLAPEPDVWTARAARALDTLEGFFDNGLITAHRNRSTYSYRGLDRRLQMTLDCLGKLAEAAARLRRLDHEPEAANPSRAFPERNELISFDDDSTAALWTYRSPHLSFVVPFVGPTLSDYLPGAQSPGLFEVPVDSDLVTGVPSIWSGYRHYTAGGIPTSVAITTEGVRAVYEGFPVAGQFERGASDDNKVDGDPGAPPLPGSWTVEYRVSGRTLQVHNTLHFERRPEIVSIQLTEAANRPLVFEVDADAPTRVDRIDTAGIKEYRSFWGELPVVHQADIDARRTMNVSWRVTPKLRVSTSAADGPYASPIYRAMQDVAVVHQFPTETIATGIDRRVLADIDVFHLHWPEWLTVAEIEVHRAFADALAEAGIPIVWTQHNLEPHTKTDLAAIYALWAQRADAAVHHSRWGRDQAIARHDFAPGTIHRVIPHPNFGDPRSPGEPSRSTLEAELGLPPCGIRLGMVGAPRDEKDVQLVLDAFAACDRADLGLFVTCLTDESVPDDERIVAIAYEHVPPATYAARLTCMDAIVLPYAEEGMLTTGVVGDVIGAALPAIVSPWRYLREALGPAAMPYDGTVEGLTAVLDTLSDSSMTRAAETSAGLRTRTDPGVIAEQHLALMVEVLATSPTRDQIPRVAGPPTLWQ